MDRALGLYFRARPLHTAGMGMEIERKFLVKSDAWRREVVRSERLRQGYLSLDPERTVRVRIAGDSAWLTIKGRPQGTARAEFEYSIPASDAELLLDRLCRQPQVDKTRHWVPAGAWTIEVDVFHGDNEGLVLAEIELESECDAPPLPAWLGPEVTGDERYFNAYLSRCPYRTWSA